MDKTAENTQIKSEEAKNSNKNGDKSTSKWTFETKSLVVLSAIFAIVLLGAWVFALQLQRTVAANNTFTPADKSAIVEVERIRNLADAQIDDSRAFFLLGSQSLYERQRDERNDLLKALATYEEKYGLEGVPAHIKDIREAMQKTQEFFTQGMEFREKKTESKIVGQFFQAKTQPLRADINKSIDQIAKLHQAEMDRVNAEARGSVVSAEASIPKGMTWLTGSLAAIFLGLSFLIIRLVSKLKYQLARQSRLYAETKKAIQDRDEALFAISHDLKDSLNLIASTGDMIKSSPDSVDFAEAGDLVKSTAITIEGLIQDIRDGKSAEMEGITLRMDQLSVDNVLDQTRLLMQPLAKKYDVRLQIDQANPPVLAFFDNDRVLRVLSNLITNAVKHSRKGEKVVVKARSDQKFVHISVTDNGEGIPAAQLDGIFDQFWQAKNTADQGAGVGLSIVKTIVTAHGGTVEIQSQPGRGTTVTFSLPRRRPAGVPLKKTTTAKFTHSQSANEWL